MFKNKTTKSKKYGFLGWFIYALSLALGTLNYVDVSLIGFLISYIVLFLWVVHYEITQLDKGMVMILSGAFFVGVLTTSAGLEVSDDRIFDVPEQLKLSFVALVAIAGATFFGAGGSMIANVATMHSSDSAININKDNKLYLVRVEKKLKAIYRLLCTLTLLVCISTVLLSCLVAYFNS
ncbi:conserved membrane hypothetical protein [Vibrio chagasii]|uniref:hypothetical protein n=1 Tax=Vibrio TaxID=662 RepID=UPI000CF3C18B|nr:hypothetical protein [Vibrio splendidus]CAH7217098.1 conserved membrane hypothetical protein [Vibrio chagasii]PQJ48577.1 hypothetical protein BTO12_24425 [Vibrio splendidus]CAH7219720.1 conserved membrane hypothetical protein [Vibrio chagasii]CAH7243135.1 conserved membrane hypothetical protein [Vibrio chagasii]CAH7357846.1 conserved membrane hypothetical protein [Vibrio chagasii]